MHIIFTENGPRELCTGLTYFGFCDNIRQAFGRKGEIPVLYFRRIMAGRKFRLFDLRRNFGSSEKIKISFFLKIFGKVKCVKNKEGKKVKQDSKTNAGSRKNFE